MVLTYYIHSELPGPAHGGSTADKMATLDESVVTKSPSDFGILGRCASAKNPRRTQSHGGGLPPNVGDKQYPLVPTSDFTDLRGIDDQAFDIIVGLVNTLLALDHCIDAWRSLMSSSWRFVSDVGRDSRPQQRLKSNFI